MAKLVINFPQDEPTAKMIDYVQDICRVLQLPKPEYTFEAYSEFIEAFKDDYWYCRNEVLDGDYERWGDE